MRGTLAQLRQQMRLVVSRLELHPNTINNLNTLHDPGKRALLESVQQPFVRANPHKEVFDDLQGNVGKKVSMGMRLPHPILQSNAKQKSEHRNTTSDCNNNEELQNKLACQQRLDLAARLANTPVCTR